MAQDLIQKNKEHCEEWEAVINALLTHMDNSLARIHEANKVVASSMFDETLATQEMEREYVALLRSARTLVTFLENSGRGYGQC